MQRSGGLGPDSDRDQGFVEKLRAGLSRLLGQARGDSRQQALPMSEYTGQTVPVLPYEERRQQLQRTRRRQRSPYSLVFLAVLLVLVVGLFYGLAWALGGMSAGAPRPTTPTAPAQLAVATPSPSPAEMAVLPTAAPGGTAPSPSPLPGTPLPPGATLAVRPGTPEQRTYVVQAGDTPGQIARQFNVSVESLMRANNISDARALRVGDRLTIPPASTPTATPTR
jgi:LysM repeat protein